jgi:iron complex transport system substrate-binding protein
MFGTCAARTYSTVLIAVAALQLLCAAAASAAVTLRDDLNREVSIPGPAQRVITMLPSLTEIVCALGACDRIVATDRFSNWPASIERLPKAGDLDDASIELIVSLRPDLVLINTAQRISTRLSELGIATFALNPQSYADEERAVTLTGQLLGASAQAAELNSRTRNRIAEIGAQAIRARQGATPSVYFEIDRTPYAAGPQSYIGELLARLGTRNIVASGLGAFPRLNSEYVVRHDPDILFVSPVDAAGLALRPGWDALPAVRARHICSFSPEVEATIMRPGPRIAEGMQAMAACIEHFTHPAAGAPR